MAFYDFDLKGQVEKKHELWDINETVNFSSLVYRLKDMEKEVGRHGYGLGVGLQDFGSGQYEPWLGHGSFHRRCSVLPSWC